MGLVPNVGIEIQNDSNHRNGLTVKIPAKKGISSFKEFSFGIRGPELFNSLPMDLREMESSMETYKRKLDMFLSVITDCPRIGSGAMSQSNNLDERIRMWKWSLRFG